MLDIADDIVLPFQLESSQLRGRFVRLGAALDVILNQHHYPDPVARLLAETMSVSAALASSLKYDGVFTVQAKGDGPVRLLVADVTNTGGIRAYAQYDEETPLPVSEEGAKLLGTGFLAFTCTASDQVDRYQGIVNLKGESLAEAVQHYFRQSEQIPTGILTSAVRDDEGLWRAGCLLLQRMPKDGGFSVETTSPQAEDWTRAMLLMQTCTESELTEATLPPEELLFRLFHEEGVRVYDTHSLRHQCRCSQARVEAMLRSLPKEEIETLTIDGRIIVTCEFCSKSYTVTPQDLGVA